MICVLIFNDVCFAISSLDDDDCSVASSAGDKISEEAGASKAVVGKRFRYQAKRNKSRASSDSGPSGCNFSV